MEELSYVSSSSKTALCSHHNLSSEEESGWTSYIDDFCACSSLLRGGGSSSLVSDASSCAAWQIPAAAELSRGFSLKKKKKKGRKALEDSALEDTASSPANNKPKGGESSFSNMKPRKRGNSKNKVTGRELGREAINEDDYVGRVKDECSDLRAKGLCLVPLSMLSNYL